MSLRFIFPTCTAFYLKGHEQSRNFEIRNNVEKKKKHFTARRILHTRKEERSGGGNIVRKIQHADYILSPILHAKLSLFNNEIYWSFCQVIINTRTGVTRVKKQQRKMIHEKMCILFIFESKPICRTLISVILYFNYIRLQSKIFLTMIFVHHTTRPNLQNYKNKSFQLKFE